MGERSTWYKAGGVVGGMVVAVVGGCVAMVVWCGSWEYLPLPFNYLGCGAGRPDGISESDLVGAYATADGGRLELHGDGSLTAVALTTEFMDGRMDLSGPGDWTLRPSRSSSGDVDLTFTGQGGRHGDHLRISGTRDEPWLYWYIGDPDACELYRFERVP